jgi:hypothetical protein
MGLVRLIGCRLNGNTFSSCVEEKLRRERDDFAPVALEKRTSAAEAVKRRLFTARLKPCPSLDGYSLSSWGHRKLLRWSNWPV